MASTRKWLICHFPEDDTYVAVDHKSLFTTGKIRFLGNAKEAVKRVKVLYKDSWYEGEVIEQWGE